LVGSHPALAGPLTSMAINAAVTFNVLRTSLVPLVTENSELIPAPPEPHTHDLVRTNHGGSTAVGDRVR
jgi:hypothetical protein